jgi:hypothetical protein
VVWPSVFGVGTYVPRNPESTVLYGAVSGHLETFLARLRDGCGTHLTLWVLVDLDLDLDVDWDQPVQLNVAEGSGKSTSPDQRRFYAMARGSAMECAAILDACRALLALIEEARAEEVDQLLLSTVRMLSKMCRP